MSDETPEARATRIFETFLRENRAALLPIAGWGDGRCGHMAELMANILVGPASPRGAPARSREIPQRVRTQVYERDRYRCVRCGSHEQLRIDHVYPFSLGGGSEPSNLQTLCHACNSAKGAKVEGGPR